MEHFPENACPGLDPGWASGFPQKQKMRPRKKPRARLTARFGPAYTESALVARVEIGKARIRSLE
jgi:hypothetical protein